MKLVSYYKDEQDQLAILSGGFLYDTDLMHPDLPVSMAMFLNYWEDVIAATKDINIKIEEGKISRQQAIEIDAVQLMQPVPYATSARCALAFEQDNYSGKPLFHFINHNCFCGPGEVVLMPGHLEKLSLEIQVAIVICKAGKNISVADADEYIGGFMIMNDFVSHNIFSEKAPYASPGRGFATAIGPMIVTADELEQFKTETGSDHKGNTFNLSIKYFVNDEEAGEGNLSSMNWTFAEIIEQASYGVQLFPGDIISGGAIKLEQKNESKELLAEGEVVEIEIEGLGKLRNIIVKEKSNEPGESDE